MAANRLYLTLLSSTNKEKSRPETALEVLDLSRAVHLNPAEEKVGAETLLGVLLT
jgi:hypothetical protein